MVDFSLVAVSAPKSSDHTDYSNLQFYGKRGITQNFLKFHIILSTAVKFFGILFIYGPLKAINNKNWM
jgi:hypothetical protein